VSGADCICVLVLKAPVAVSGFDEWGYSPR
jgi:hypothetical protein